MGNDYSVTYEVCPHCGNEVKLDAELKVQKCPVCGRYIVPCSMCGVHCPKLCPLENLALKLNEIEIMSCVNKHDSSLVKEINRLWGDSSYKFEPIMRALYIRDLDKMNEKEIFSGCEEVLSKQFNWKAYAHDYLMQVAVNKDLQLIINFIVNE